MRRIYLSIDLDYWRSHDDSVEPQVTQFFKRVLALKKTIAVAVYHHHLLEHINRCRRLTDVINVDYHSDIQDLNQDGTLPDDVGEGSWANFVEGRERMAFTWRYPLEECITPTAYDPGPGYCHGSGDPFTEPTCIDWRRVIKKQGIARLPWRDIVAVGVCLSPYWLGNISTLYYPFEQFQLYEWYARWQESENYRGHNEYMHVSRQKGAEKAKIRLHRPRCVV